MERSLIWEDGSNLASLKQNLLVSEQGERVWIPIGLVRRWIQQEWG